MFWRISHQKWWIEYAIDTMNMIYLTENTIVGMLRVVEMDAVPLQTKADVEFLLESLKAWQDTRDKVDVVLYHLNDNGTGGKVPALDRMTADEKKTWELQCRYK